MTTGDVLTQRGIGDDTRTTYQIAPATWYQQAGFVYPTYSLDGVAARRWKNADSAGSPKYGWAKGEKQEGHGFYLLPGLREAIAAAGGLAYWTSGEPDTWTLHAASQTRTTPFPALSAFGEGNELLRLRQYTEALGIRTLRAFPDLDLKGFSAAHKLRAVCAELGLPLELLKLPGPFDSKEDLNKLWVALRFDPALFWDDLERCAQVGEVDWKFYELDKPIELPAPPAAAPAPNGSKPGGEIDWPAEQREWVERIVAALGSPDKHEGGIARWHCPLPGHADAHPSFRVDRTSDLPRPRCSCDIHNHEDAWDQVARAVGIETWDEVKGRLARAHKPERAVDLRSVPGMEVRQAEAQPAPVDDFETYFVSRSQALKTYVDEINGDSIPEVEPLVFPMNLLHQAGGNAHIVLPGKIVGIACWSGGGKTAIVETLYEAENKRGGEVVSWQPEQTDEKGVELAGRSVQRSGGVDLEQKALNDLWNIEAAMGIPEWQRHGARLGDATISQAIKMASTISKWPAETHYIIKPDASAEWLCRAMAHKITSLRAAGKKVRMVVFDYAQLLWLEEDNEQQRIWLETAVGKIKAFALEQRVVPFITVQMRKDDAEHAKGSGKVSANMMQWLTDQKFNLLLLLQHIYEDGERTERAKITVAKNNMGREGIVLETQTELARLTWMDTPTSTARHLRPATVNGKIDF